MAEPPLPGLFQLTPFNPDFQADPHVVLDDLRGRCPVHRDEAAGSFILTRYADIRPLVSDRTLWRSPLRAEEAATIQRRFAEADLGDQPIGETTSILMLDDPDHARIRQPLAQALYARAAKFRPEVERIVDDTLDRIDASKPFDLMTSFCIPIPIDVIASILGVDRSRLAEFRRWSEAVIQGLNPFITEEARVEMEAANTALFAYFDETFQARRADPKDDLISDMTRLQAEGAALSDTELQINLAALLIGGNLTTTDLIGNGVRQLLLNPEELAKLKADPGIVKDVVEEILRFRAAGRHHRPHRLARHGRRRMPGEDQPEPDVLATRGEPRSRGIREPTQVRRDARAQAARGVRRRRPYLHWRAARAAGGASRAGQAVRTVPEPQAGRAGGAGDVAHPALLPRSGTPGPRGLKRPIPAL